MVLRSVTYARVTASGDPEQDLLGLELTVVADVDAERQVFQFFYCFF